MQKSGFVYATLYCTVHRSSFHAVIRYISLESDSEYDRITFVSDILKPRDRKYLLVAFDTFLCYILQRKDRIKKLEEANIAEKPWQLKGEVTSSKRPVNSLLEEHVTFDYTSTGGKYCSLNDLDYIKIIVLSCILHEMLMPKILYL